MDKAEDDKVEQHISALREQARQCRTLARATEHRPTAAMFEQMAIEYEVQANTLEPLRRSGPAAA